MQKLGDLRHNQKNIEVFLDGRIVVRTGDMFQGTCKEYNLFDFVDGNYVHQSKIDTTDRYIQLLCDAQRSGHDVHQEIDEALKLYRQEAGI